MSKAENHNLNKDSIHLSHVNEPRDQHPEITMKSLSQ